MSKYDYIHETVIRDITDLISDVKDNKGLLGMFDRSKSYKSVNHATSNLVLVFPQLTSTAVLASGPDIAVMVAKANERKITNLLHILFSAISMEEAEDAIEFVKQYHVNLNAKGKITVDDFIDGMNNYANIIGESFYVDRDKYDAVIEDLKDLSTPMPNMVNETALFDYKVKKDLTYGDYQVQLEAPTVKTGAQILADTEKNLLSRMDKLDKDIKSRRDSLDINLNTKGGSRRGPSADDIKKGNELQANRVISNELKKANELVPTLMVVNFCAKDADSPIVGTAIIGVKAKIYPIESDDILTRIKLKAEDKELLQSFIRASTRETSFWRDFIFAIDKAKIDALSQSKRGSSSKLWKVLERRSIKSKIRRGLGMKNDATAISTLVITSEEVEYLKKFENINLDNAATFRTIMESYNLMGGVIVNETMETCKFISDTGDDEFELLSFTHLERESSDNTYKKVVNLMSKYSR